MGKCLQSSRDCFSRSHFGGTSWSGSSRGWWCVICSSWGTAATGIVAGGAALTGAGIATVGVATIATVPSVVTGVGAGVSHIIPDRERQFLESGGNPQFLAFVFIGCTQAASHASAADQFQSLLISQLQDSPRLFRRQFFKKPSREKKDEAASGEMFSGSPRLYFQLRW